MIWLFFFLEFRLEIFPLAVKVFMDVQVLVDVDWNLLSLARSPSGNNLSIRGNNAYIVAMEHFTASLALTKDAGQRECGFHLADLTPPPEAHQPPCRCGEMLDPLRTVEGHRNHPHILISAVIFL